MAISNKNINTLVNKFVKNNKDMESYIKYLIKLLDNYCYLKKEQYNKEIDSYDYVSKYISYNSISFDSLLMINEQYLKNIVDKQNKVSIKSNIYYLNKLESFLDKMDFNNNKIEEKNICRFYRLDFEIFNLGNIDLDKVYTYLDVYNMVLNNDIVVLDSYLDNDYINVSNLNNLDNNIVLIEPKCCEVLGIRSKTFETYYSLSKDMWKVINKPLCNYIRYRYIDFNNDNSFDNDFNHAIELINEIKKYYKRRRKDIPKNVDNLLNSSLNKIEMIYERYESIDNNKEDYILKKVK